MDKINFFALILALSLMACGVKLDPVPPKITGVPVPAASPSPAANP